MMHHGNREPKEYQRVIDGIEKPQPENLFTQTIYEQNGHQQSTSLTLS